MTKAKNSENNDGNYLNLLQILRDKQKIRLGNFKSGEYITLEYNIEGASLQPEKSPNISSSLNSMDDVLSEAEANANPQLLVPIEQSTASEATTNISFEGDLNNTNEKTIQRDSTLSNTTSISKLIKVSDADRIAEFIFNYYRNFVEIQSLCFKLKISIDIIKDETIFLMCKKLVDYCYKNDIQNQLITMIENETGDSIKRNNQRLNDIYDLPVSPKVFISYSHDSDEHRNLVLSLAQRLWNDGIIECEIDQLYEDDPPSEGWPSWTKKQVKDAEFVLIICTRIYHKRFERQESSGGRGVAWEGAIINSIMYETYVKNNKFVPIVFSEQELEHIPDELKITSTYILDKEQQYKNLLHRITKQNRVRKPATSTVLKLPSRQISPLKFDNS